MLFQLKDTPVLDLKKRPATDADKKPVYMSDFIGEALANYSQQDNKDLKLSKYKVLKKFIDCEGEPIDLNNDEITIIINAVGAMYSPLVLGQINEKLNGENNSEPAKPTIKKGK